MGLMVEQPHRRAVACGHCESWVDAASRYHGDICLFLNAYPLR